MARYKPKRRIFISSLPPLVRRHARHLREHGSIENTLHHTLDVTFAKDSGRIRIRLRR